MLCSSSLIRWFASPAAGIVVPGIIAGVLEFVNTLRSNCPGAVTRGDLVSNSSIMTTYVSPSPGQKVQANLARSWLLVNAVQPARFQPAEDSAADVIVYDIEDAVAPKDKDRARQHVVDQFSNGHTGRVRINGYGTQWWEEDVTELAKYISDELDGSHHNGGLVGLMLAMVESSDHVNVTAARLPGVPIVALVETAP